jgi:hypothetical protein
VTPPSLIDAVGNFGKMLGASRICDKGVAATRDRSLMLYNEAVSQVRPKEGRWIARPKRPRWVVPAMTLILFASLAPNWLNPLFSRGPFGALFGLAAVLILVMLVIGCVAFKNLIVERRAPQDSAFVDGAFGDQFLVEVTIVAGKNRLGTDRGVLWFSDNLMGFSGAATSFVLSAKDVRVEKKALGRDNQLPDNAIILKGAPRTGYFMIHPIGKAAKAYEQRLRAFLIMDVEHEGERVWPPLVPYDERQALETTRRPILGG